MTLVPLPEPQWYAVRAKPRKEEAAAAKLARAGYWPWYAFDRVRRRRRRGNVYVVEWVNQPHYPGYVFFALRFVGESFDAVDAIDEISEIIRTPLGRVPARIPFRIMDQIMDSAMVRFGDVEMIAGLMREIAIEQDREIAQSLSRGRRRREARKADATREVDVAEKEIRIRVGLLR